MSSSNERPSPRDMWEQRYGGDEYIYGTAPNDFLRDTMAALPPGDVLCLADGEGRNGVHLAGLGHRVTSVDLTDAGMAKAARLAADREVALTTVVADLATYDFGTDRWDYVVSIFAHTPPPVRARIHAAMVDALRPGGLFVLEAYTPDQVGRGTGGPPVPELTMTLDGLRDELTGLAIESGVETERSVTEGLGHTGEGSVVQVIARRPDPKAIDWVSFNRPVVDEYRANEGRLSGRWEGNPTLLLTTTGARSGLPRTSPLTYTTDGDRLVLIASRAGDDRHPDWYHNLVAIREVEVELGADRFRARADVATEPERTRLFDARIAAMPRFGDYQILTGREIPVVVLTRTD